MKIENGSDNTLKRKNPIARVNTSGRSKKFVASVKVSKKRSQTIEQESKKRVNSGVLALEPLVKVANVLSPVAHINDCEQGLAWYVIM